MTLAEMIAEICDLHPNQYPKEILTRWVSECEATAVEQVLNHIDGNDIEFDEYNYDTDADTELLVGGSHKDIYVNYVTAKIDYANREFGAAENANAMYAAAFDDFASHYKRAYRQKRKGYMRQL